MKCTFCKTSAKALIRLPNYLYCQRCNYAWLKNFPKTLYGDEYYKGTSSLASKIFTPVARFFYHLRSSYAGYSKKRVWVDVGAGDGGFLKTVNATNKIGVEKSAAGRRLMKKSGIATMTDTKFLQTTRLNADVISFWHVLEHTTNPWKYLAAAKRNIGKRGTVIIGVPNLDCLEYRLFGKRWFHSPQYHMYQFTPYAIERFLTKYGFAVLSIDHWSLEHHLPCLLQSFINATAGSDAVLHRIIKRGHTQGFTKTDVFWSIFWLTIGAPIVILFWIIQSLTRKSGTVVIVARPAI